MSARFAKHYDLEYQKLVDYENETVLLEKLFKKFCRKKPQTILDVGCGTGTHALLLSKRRYGVTGIDLSKKMIELARNKANEEHANIEFHVQDMREIKLKRTFDCAICMFGGFGYLLEHTDLVKTFTSLRNHLNEDGLFIFEFWTVGGVKASPYQSWTKSQAKDLLLYRLSESNFQPETNIMKIDFHFIEIHPSKSPRISHETHRLRCYTIAEMHKYLSDNGFKLVAASDWSAKDKQLESPKRESFRILGVARKAQST